MGKLHLNSRKVEAMKIENCQLGFHDVSEIVHSFYVEDSKHTQCSDTIIGKI
mgnify:CR=1 FL=1